MKAQIRAQQEAAIAERVDNYLQTVVNQAVVLLCSVLEIVLDQVLEVIFTERREALIGFAEEKSIDIRLVVETADQAELMKIIRERTIGNFSRETIGKKIGLLGRKLGLEQASLFDWTWLEADLQAQLRDQNLDSLVAIFDRRHDIVHRGLRPFRTMDEVHSVVTFFEYFILNLCRVIVAQFHLDHDFPAPL